MPVATHLARSYALRMVIIAIVSLVLGLWGAWDLWVTIPRDRAIFQEYGEKTDRRAEIAQREADGEQLTEQEIAEYQALEIRIDELAPDKSVPVEPGAFDEFIQWMYISCFPFGIWYLISYYGINRKSWKLDENGSLHLPGGEVWQTEEIADIDMSKWMAKSKAFVVHADGRREVLDDYIHKDSHLIVGALAHARYPDQWHEDAKMVKTEEEEAVPGDESPDFTSNEGNPEEGEESGVAEMASRED